MGLQIRNIKIEPSLCTGCYMCMLICSFVKFKVFNPKVSLIRIDYNYKVGKVERVAMCSQCSLCSSVCPTKAIHVNPGGFVGIDHSKCIRCFKCVSVCPTNSIVVYNDFPYKCDLCGGDPQCVKYCLTGALHV